jgi:hypothetical protein
MGHTHLPDERTFDNGRYFNPGCWTRYLDLEKHPNLKLKALQNEDNFPYELNYVGVGAGAGGAQLVARLVSRRVGGEAGK